MNPLVKRVARLEKYRPGEGLDVIIITGGLPEGDTLHATAGAHSWDCDPDESFEAFRVRASTAALEAGERLLIIGGLRGDSPRPPPPPPYMEVLP